ncbi:acyl-CoA dehydrogenase family protein [Paracoccaceae bacterium]|jgi:alkylation response protein AidB-like acyl-CoA dehydrogenase|nr:acyl-CoA dehydrogenase family protein [Paracoccaceae bacterium]
MNIFDKLYESAGWNEEERLVLDQVQRVADQVIAPHAEEADTTGEFPWVNVNALNKLGLNMLFIPERFGGAPMRVRLYLEVVKIISEACASTGIIYATNYHGMKPLIEYGSEAQQARLLPAIAEGGLGALAITEPTAGSDATGMMTRFTLDGDEIIVDGTKTFITNGDVADRILLFGKWSDIEGPKEAISALILEKGTPGFDVVGKERKMGHRASSTCMLSFSGARVARANLIGEPGEGLRILLGSLNKSRPSVAAHALGIARAAFKDILHYTNERQQSRRKIIEFQGIQFGIADLASELALTETWLDHVARMIDTGAEDYSTEASIAKMRASDLAMKMTTEAVQYHGGYGYCADYRAERLMRDAKITQIWEGTNQVHRQLIGRSFVNK